MKLAAYLAKHKMTGKEFADRIGVDDATINRLIPREGKKQTRKPSFELIEKIMAATSGEVTANDFLTGCRDEPSSPDMAA